MNSFRIEKRKKKHSGKPDSLILAGPAMCGREFIYRPSCQTVLSDIHRIFLSDGFPLTICGDDDWSPFGFAYIPSVSNTVGQLKFSFLQVNGVGGSFQLTSGRIQGVHLRGDDNPSRLIRITLTLESVWRGRNDGSLRS